MNDFNGKLIEVIQQKIIKGIANQELISINYNDRISLPKSFIQEVYDALDINKIKARLIEKLENEMADKIANKLMTEYSNDIKQIMSNQELREDLRCFARAKIKELSNSLSKND